MKREIKFRGKSKNTGDWLYGVPVKSVNDNMYLIHSATEDAINTFNDVDFVYSEVIPETVGQFTGLKDKNGVEIYEGDIFHLGDKKIIYTVVWHDTGLTGKQNGASSYVGLEHWKEHIAIIGNIFDNPELVRKQKKYKTKYYKIY